jgi:hypothetical protein
MKTLVLILFYGFQQCFPSRQFCRFYHVISETSKIKLGVNLRCFSKLHSRKQSLWFLRKHAGYFLSVFWGKTAWKTLDMILQCFHRKLPENCVSLFPMLFSMFRSITSIIACSVVNIYAYSSNAGDVDEVHICYVSHLLYMLPDATVSSW